jgi:hypothetical protein
MRAKAVIAIANQASRLCGSLRQVCQPVRAGQSEVVASFPDLRQTKADSDRNAGVAMVSVGRSLRELGSRRHLFSVGVWLAKIPTAAISAPNRGERGEATHCRPGLGQLRALTAGIWYVRSTSHSRRTLGARSGRSTRFLPTN